MRKAIGPQRDLLARMVSGVAQVPGMTPELTRYYRDAYDHMIRIFDLVDTYRDLLSGAMEVYLSTVSNRLNVVMKKLAIMGTFFLPLTWVTGFFGMNFGYLVREVDTAWAFFVFGLVTQIAHRGGSLLLVLAPQVAVERGPAHTFRSGVPIRAAAGADGSRPRPSFLWSTPAVPASWRRRASGRESGRRSR